MTNLAPPTLGEFLLNEMTKRSMSASEFARFLGVPHSIVNKFLNHGTRETYAGKPVGNPSWDFLVKVADATGYDICTLAALVDPKRVRISGQALLLAERIERLPPEMLQLVDRFLLGAEFKPLQQDE